MGEILCPSDIYKLDGSISAVNGNSLCNTLFFAFYLDRVE